MSASSPHSSPAIGEPAICGSRSATPMASRSDARKGPGAAESRGKHAEVFDELRPPTGAGSTAICRRRCAAWWARRSAGSRCPIYRVRRSSTSSRRIPPAFATVSSSCSGMRCSNPLGAPDVMRGEETQLLGARHLDASLEDGKQLVCMPGTHTKWVSLHEGVVQEFLTAPTGEVFAMLCEHSVLVRDQATPVVHQARGLRARARGVGASSGRESCCTACSRAAVCASTSSSRQKARHRGCRACSSDRMWPARCPCSRTRRALRRCTSSARRQLTESYSRALARHGRKAVCIEGDKAALAGPQATCISNRSARRHERELTRTRGHPARTHARARAGSGCRAGWLRLPDHRSAAQFAGALRHHQAPGTGAWRHLPDRRGHGADSRRSR